MHSGVWRAFWQRDPVPNYMSNLFASKFSQRVRDVGRKNFKNAVLTNVAAAMMDSSAGLRQISVRQDHQRFAATA